MCKLCWADNTLPSSLVDAAHPMLFIFYNLLSFGFLASVINMYCLGNKLSFYWVVFYILQFADPCFTCVIDSF